MTFRILALDGGGIKGSFTAMLLVDRRFHRIDHKAPRGQFSLDDARPGQIERLIALGRGEAVKRENIEVVRERFLNSQQAPRFQPVYVVE